MTFFKLLASIFVCIALVVTVIVVLTRKRGVRPQRRRS